MIISESNKLFKEIQGNLVLATSYSQIDTFLTCPYKWYLKYVEGIQSEEKQIALAYGSTIHEVLEDYFNSWGRLDGRELSERFNEYARKNQIPYTDPEDMIRDLADATKMTYRICRMKQRYENKEEVSKIEKLFLTSKPIGVEEKFEIKYKLPVPVEINDKIYEHIFIIGSIDLHEEFTFTRKGEQKIFHYLVDHKSGKKKFNKEKLETDLQFPIYSFYLLRQYKTLPAKCFYHFTRTGESQEVVVDKVRINQAIEKINSVFSDMYNFTSDKNKRPVTEDNPSFPLCWWCDYHKEKMGKCDFCSNYKPKDK